MAEESRVEYCILNVAASPHPEGIYVKLLRDAAGIKVKYWGDRFATISKPVERDGFWQGRVATWDAINFDEPGIQTDALEEIDLSEFAGGLPTNVGFNGRLFLYTLREADHVIFVETLNDAGKSLSPSQAGKIFASLFSRDILGDDAPVVSVTVLPEEDAIDRILEIPILRKLHIHLVRPNPDDIGDDADEVLAELVDQGAKSQDITLTAVAGEGLRPNEHTRAQVAVAEANGFVDGRGRQLDGTRVSYSTKEHPRIIKRIINEFGSIYESALNVARETVVRKRRR